MARNGVQEIFGGGFTAAASVGGTPLSTQRRVIAAVKRALNSNE